MRKSRLAACVGAVLTAAGGGLLAQDFGSAPSAMGGSGRAHVYSQGEMVGFVLLLAALALFVAAWHMAGKEHRSRW
jgi:hypothetical protein